jgi:serine/threonine-protein kinase
MRLKDGQIYAGKYRIARKLGDGAMGTVYEAEDLLGRRRVAIKVLHPHIAERRGALHRLEVEARAASRIGSRHIVEILDVGELQGDTRFLVVELLDGVSLAQRIRAAGRIKPEEAAGLVVQLLGGLEAAHAAGIAHHDLKPANIFLTDGGDLVKILDFGVSQLAAAGDDMGTTGAGSVLGTPFYMSPEQAKGSRRIDHRSDLYAVGVILYECVTGEVPFAARTVNELIFRIMLEAPTPAESIVPDLDPGFVAILHKAMAREASERFQTAREMRDALARWLSVDHVPVGLDTASAMHWAGTPRRARGSELPLVLGLLAALALGGATLFAVRPDASVAGPPRVAAAPIAPVPPLTPTLPVQSLSVMEPAARAAPTDAPLSLPPASATPSARVAVPSMAPRRKPAAVVDPAQRTVRDEP